MSAIANQLVVNTKAICSTACGAGYQELAHVYEPRRNNARQAKKAYGVRIGNAEPASSVTTVYTVDHIFEIILMDTVARVVDKDTELQDAITTILDKADEIFRRLVQTKVNLQQYVLGVFDQRISAPEIIEGETKMVQVILQVSMKYRNALIS